MTTAVYNSPSIGTDTDQMTLSPIDVRIESEASPEEVSQFLVSLASLILAADTPDDAHATAYDPREAEAYRLNKYGDEYAFVDELGFETSWMGLRADHNHIL